MFISKISPRNVSEIAKLKVRVLDVFNQSCSSKVQPLPSQRILKRRSSLAGWARGVCLCSGPHLPSSPHQGVGLR